MSTKTPNKQASEKEQTQKRVARKSQQPNLTLQPSPTEASQRVVNAPRAAVRPADILALQSSVGNRAVQRLVERAGPWPRSQALVQRHNDNTVDEVAVGKLRIEQATQQMEKKFQKVESDVGKARSELPGFRESADWTLHSLTESAGEDLHGESEPT